MLKFWRKNVQSIYLPTLSSMKWVSTQADQERRVETTLKWKRNQWYDKIRIITRNAFASSKGCVTYIIYNTYLPLEYVLGI